MVRKNVLLPVLVLGALALLLAAPATGLVTDIAGHWAGGVVAALEAKGVISGDTASRFDPEGPLSRAHMAKMLVVSLGNGPDADLLKGYPSRFSDVPTDHWALGYVESLAEADVFRGYPDGRFGLGESLSRAQMAVVMVRAAGLAEQARLQRLEATPFTDDADIPEWARGEVGVAARLGLFSGFEDGSFRPHEQITRAQGAVTVLRLEQYKGSAFHLQGTLLRFDANTRAGILRDSIGQEHPFVMDAVAQYYRSGQRVGAADLQRLDQAWVVMGPLNRGLFMESRFHGLHGTNATLAGGRLTLEVPGQGTQVLALQPGALTFLNGRSLPHTASTTLEATHAFVAMDASSGQVRMVDFVQATGEGRLVGIDTINRTVTLTINQRTVAVRVSQDALIFRDGVPVELRDLIHGLSTLVAQNESGEAVYLQVEG